MAGGLACVPSDSVFADTNPSTNTRCERCKQARAPDRVRMLPVASSPPAVSGHAQPDGKFRRKDDWPVAASMPSEAGFLTWLVGKAGIANVPETRSTASTTAGSVSASSSTSLPSSSMMSATSIFAAEDEPSDVVIEEKVEDPTEGVFQ